ncbi:MAG: sulfatase-like hydrolase/transferase [Actinomycetota bacterium]|nr:sulfatase-like hydrolase/transferase [Actinomycetota bacterium]
MRPLLELLALTGMAVAQPVLDVFARGADTLVARGVGPLDIVVFTIAVVLGPPVLLWGIELLVGLVSPSLARWLHLAFVALLGGVLAVLAAKELTGFEHRGLLASGVLGAGALTLVARLAAVRLWLRYLAVAPLAFAALFLFASPVTRLAFAGEGGGAAAAGIDRPAPVVMVVLDELPTASLLDGEGAIDRVLFPNLAALADESTWYRNHTTVAPYTAQAVPALLTGRWPDDTDKLPLAAEYPDNLFTLLRAYHLNVVERITRLCPVDLCGDTRTIGTQASVRSLLIEAADVWRVATTIRRSDGGVSFDVEITAVDPDAPSRFQEFIDSLERSRRPRLDFLHVLLPHQNWQYLPSGQRYVAPNPPEGTYVTYWISEAAAAAARQRHVLQLQYTDRLVGRLVERLRDLGAYDDSLIVVTSDHGVAFREGSPVRGVSEGNYSDIMWTPLLIKGPGQQDGAVSDAPVTSVDVVPTVADHLGFELPPGVGGSSALEGGLGSGGVRRLFDWGQNELRPTKGRYLELDGEAGFRTVLSARASDGSGPPALRPFQVGRFADLVGSPVDDLPRGGVAPFTFRLDDPEALADVALDADELSAYVSGDVDTDQPVAVAVNGTVGGWFEPRGDDDRLRFWALMPPSLLRDGHNDVELFVIEGEPGAVTLRPIPLE